MSKEIWKDIKGYEGLYQVSNMGRVKSVERWKYHPKCKDNKQYIPERIKTPSERISKGRSTGYLVTQLYKDNKIKNFYIHRLAAESFIPNPDN